MSRISLYVDWWNVAKAAGRLHQRLHLGELPIALAGPGSGREILFQQIYYGPMMGRDAALRIQRINGEAQSFGYTYLLCESENGAHKSQVDLVITGDMITHACLGRADILALCAGDVDYAFAVRRAATMGVRVEVYAVNPSRQFVAVMARHAHLVRDLADLNVLHAEPPDAMEGLFEDELGALSPCPTGSDAQPVVPSRVARHRKGK